MRERSSVLRTLVLAFGLGLCVACGDAAFTGPGPITDPAAQVVTSTRGAVASSQPLATEVGAEILAQGGNAIDAAVATAFTLAVVEPSMSGLGGRTSIVIRRSDGTIHGIDGLNQVPSSYAGGAPDGYDQAAVPGTPAALAHALEEHGTLSLAEVLAPAIELAEEGFTVLPGDAGRMQGARSDLAQHEASTRYFLRPDGSTYAAGERLVQEDLARALRAIAEGGIDVFYHGWIADSIHVAMVENGGYVTRDELASYEARSHIPARGSYRGFEVAANFRPSSGHSVVQALQMMEEFEVPPGSRPVEWAALAGQAMRIAIADRGRSFGSPEESAAVLTSKEYARDRATGITPPPLAPPGGDPAPGTGTFAEVAIPEGSWLATDAENTTHLSVADADGTVVSLTQSIGPVMGTRLAARGVGFLYATRLGSTPGSRPTSTISPTILLHPDGDFALAVGAAGNTRIISATIQTISRWIDHELPLDAAVGAPRVHPVGEGRIRMEDDVEIGWTPAHRSALADLGFSISTASSQYFGRVHAVSLEPSTGVFTGVADPRRAGSAAAPEG